MKTPKAAAAVTEGKEPEVQVVPDPTPLAVLQVPTSQAGVPPETADAVTPVMTIADIITMLDLST